MKNFVLTSLICLGLFSMGCSNGGGANVAGGTESTTSAPLSLPGAYETTACFKNVAASQGIGQDIYTQATLTFNSDFTGQTDFSLYSDSACTQLLGNGTATTTYEVSRSNVNFYVVKVNQTDPSDPSNNSTYWLALQLVSGGAYIHVDGERTDSGPFASEPSDTDLAAFIADPAGVGVYFERQ